MNTYHHQVKSHKLSGFCCPVSGISFCSSKWRQMILEVFSHSEHFFSYTCLESFVPTQKLMGQWELKFMEQNAYYSFLIPVPNRGENQLYFTNRCRYLNSYFIYNNIFCNIFRNLQLINLFGVNSFHLLRENSSGIEKKNHCN